MNIGFRLIVATGALVSCVLLLQGAFSQMMMKTELKSAAVSRLKVIADKKVLLFEDLLSSTHKTLSTIQAHDAVERHFAALTDGDAAETVSSDRELLRFFVRIRETSPGYTGLMLTDRNGNILLEVVDGQSSVAEESARLLSGIAPAKGAGTESDAETPFASRYVMLPDGKNGWTLAAASPINPNGKLEGFVVLLKPLGPYLDRIFADLEKEGVQYAIYTKQNTLVTHSRDAKKRVVEGLWKGSLPEMIVEKKEIPQLGIRISLGLRKAKAFETLNDLFMIGIGVLFLSVLVSMAVLDRIARSISQPIKRLIEWADSIAVGDLTMKPLPMTSDEIGQLNSGYRKIVSSFRELSSVCENISEGNFDRCVQVKSDRDVLALSVNKMIDNLKHATKENNNRDWLKNGVAELNDVMRGEQDTRTLAANIVTCLARLLHTPVGEIFLLDDDGMLTLVGGYASSDASKPAPRFALGEGLAGQAAKGKSTIFVDCLPEGYVSVRSGLGEAPPSHLVLAPLLFDGEILGVLELGCFGEFSDLKKEFIKLALESIAISLNSARSRSRIGELLAQTQAQTNELAVQQEELRQINEELEEQAAALEKQRNELMNKNLLLDNTSQALEEKARELEQSSRYKSQFLANMSHELRTPLNSLLILSKLLADNKENNLTTKQVEYARTINNSGSDLLTLINDILDISKIEAGKMDVNPEAVRIEEVLKDMEGCFAQVAQQKGISFAVELRAGAPETVFTDRQRLVQILRNLLSNALKFTHSGGVTLTAGFAGPDALFENRGLSPGAAVAFTVRDTGIGIPEDKRELIFEAFRQVDGSTSRTYGGTGLGLTITRSLAELLGGEVQLESVAEKGSAFTLFIPATPAGTEDAAAQGSASLAPCEEKGKDFRSPVRKGTNEIRDDRRNINASDKVVLIIEDDPKFAQILFDLVRQRGFKGLLAGDGESGLFLADFFVPNAVLLDIGLPRMNGIAVMKRLKSEPNTAGIPVYCVSAFDRGKEALAMGAVDFIPKPISGDQLSALFSEIEGLAARESKRVLVVDDDPGSREAVMGLMEGEHVATVAAGTAEEAIGLLRRERFDCIVLDLGLPDRSGIELLEMIRSEEHDLRVPVIIYTGRDLSEEEGGKLELLAESVVIKCDRSPERLCDEISLFLHSVGMAEPQPTQEPEPTSYDREVLLKGKKVLVADDDMRNAFALSSALEGRGMTGIIARNGMEAVRLIDEHPDIDIVLMDIMMPVMDGHEALREIRKRERCKDLPIIAITAKAMMGDRNACIEAGASDYMSKPIEIEKMLSLMRVWLYKQR